MVSGQRGRGSKPDDGERDGGRGVTTRNRGSGRSAATTTAAATSIFPARGDERVGVVGAD